MKKILLIAAAVALLAAGCNKATQENTDQSNSGQQQEQTQTSGKTTDKTYLNAKYGINVTVPRNVSINGEGLLSKDPSVLEFNTTEIGLFGTQDLVVEVSDVSDSTMDLTKAPDYEKVTVLQDYPDTSYYVASYSYVTTTQDFVTLKLRLEGSTQAAAEKDSANLAVFNKIVTSIK